MLKCFTKHKIYYFIGAKLLFPFYLYMYYTCITDLSIKMGIADLSVYDHGLFVGICLFSYLIQLN